MVRLNKECVSVCVSLDTVYYAPVLLEREECRKQAAYRVQMWEH